ncbi:MAG: amidohydrolase family protein, partial [Chloroflexi bacterium]|nr:amidohydrolase family protein [Chloroflexota bacterium]
MSTLLVRHIQNLITLNADRQQTRGERSRTIADGAIFVRDNLIEYVGPTADLPPDRSTADRVIDAREMIVRPGMVNTHHHLYQTLTRCIAVDSGLFNWLKTLYPIWARMDGEAVYASALTGMAELILSGCTTSSDHLYLFPNGAKLDDEIRAAQEIGLRFHAARGSMSLGESKGGLPPDSVVESEGAILKDCVRVIETFHDPKPGAMIRVVIAPCSPFSVTQSLMREAAALARQYGVQLHTHLAETFDEDDFCKQMFGVLPVEYAEQVAWLGDDVWYAHSVHVRPQDIDLMARTQTGAA